jgi:putative ABC transport system permease protein
MRVLAARLRSLFTDGGQRGLPSLRDAALDLRQGVRVLRGAPGFAAATVLMLSLATALNATAFRVLDTVLLRGYPLVHDNDRLLSIDERSPRAGCCVSYFDFEHWRREAHAFQDMAFMAPRSIRLAEGDEDGRTQWAAAWTANIFQVLGVAPVLGRDFAPTDTAPGATSVLIASYRYWQTRLAGRPDVVGQTVRIDGAPVTVIGVMPEGFEFPSQSDVWLPLTETPELRQRLLNGGAVYGRLAPGATQVQARVELEAINQRLAREYPDTNRDVRPIVRNYRESRGSDATLFYGSLWLGAWFVLGIACANAANLALARANERSHEWSMRLALGARRGRLVRQLFLEHLVLVAMAGLAAWGLSAAGTHAWAVATNTLESAYDYSVGAGTWVYFLAVTFGAAVLITLAPMTCLWRLDVQGTLRGEARGATMNLRAKRLATLLVAVQMASAVVLLAGAGVLGRSVWNILTADVGVTSPERVLIGRITLPPERYLRAESRGQFFDALTTRLGTLPGVETAAVSNSLPADDFEPRALEIDGRSDERHATPIFAAGPGYFRAIGAHILSGRDFASADRPGALPVALVNQRFADAYLFGQDVIGQRIRIYEKGRLEPGEWHTIVGVASNVMQNESTRQQFQPAVYVPLAQQAPASAWLFVRATRMWDGLATTVRTELGTLDSTLEITDSSTLKASLGFDFESSRMMGSVRDLSKNAVIAPFYATLALLLAAIGLYAVVARSVERRRTEMGIRMALGATWWDIRWLVLVEGMAPVLVGLTIGVGMSLGVNHMFRAQLVGLSPSDTLTLSVAPLVLIAVALAGCLLPTRAAINVDPAAALRQD